MRNGIYLNKCLLSTNNYLILSISALLGKTPSVILQSKVLKSFVYFYSLIKWYVTLYVFSTYIIKIIFEIYFLFPFPSCLRQKWKVGPRSQWRDRARRSIHSRRIRGHCNMVEGKDHNHSYQVELELVRACQFCVFFVVDVLYLSHYQLVIQFIQNLI